MNFQKLHKMLFACVATFVTAASAVDEVGAAENALRIGRDWSFDPAANEVLCGTVHRN